MEDRRWSPATIHRNKRSAQVFEAVCPIFFPPFRFYFPLFSLYQPVCARPPTCVTRETDEADFRICNRTGCGLFRGTNRSATNYRSNEWVLTAASLTRNYRRNGKSFIAFKILAFFLSPFSSLLLPPASTFHCFASASSFLRSLVLCTRVCTYLCSFRGPFRFLDYPCV